MVGRTHLILASSNVGLISGVSFLGLDDEDPTTAGREAVEWFSMFKSVVEGRGSRNWRLVTRISWDDSGNYYVTTFYNAKSSRCMTHSPDGRLGSRLAADAVATTASAKVPSSADVGQSTCWKARADREECASGAPCPHPSR